VKREREKRERARKEREGEKREMNRERNEERDFTDRHLSSAMTIFFGPLPVNVSVF
jgi:hypothetical protein